MSLSCNTNNRLAGPVGTTPIQFVSPPMGPPVPDGGATSFLEPGPATVPGYLAIARAHADVASESPTALARLAQAELSAGKVDAAVSAATAVLDLTRGETDPSAEFAAVQVLRAGGAAGEARNHIREATKTDEIGRSFRARLAIECGDLDKARLLVEDVATFDGMFIGGWLAMQADEHPQAIALFRKATRIAGPTPDVLTNTGYSYAALGHLRQAIAATRQAQALAPHRRMIAFNLVSFYLAAGDYAAATKALEPLQRVFPDDVEIALASAHIALRANDRKEANKILQRARTSKSWATAPSIRRAELEANLALLRWFTGRNSLDDARKIVLEQLAATDYESLPIASLLPALLPSFSDRVRLETLLGQLEARHDAKSLLFLRVHDAILRQNVEAAVSLAVEWAGSDPFNPVAAGLAIQLLGDLAGDRERAIELGRYAIRRAPGDSLLLNNLAYVLALSGEVREARAVLGKVTTPDVSPAVVATRGLIDLLSGDVPAGIAGYKRAGALAVEQGKELVAQLAALNLDVALRRVDPEVLTRLGIEVAPQVEIPKSSEDDPGIWLLATRAEHDGVRLIWSRDSGALDPR
jgi:Flp pilus assembly protein TadD